jgi:DNA polymerase-3 subunit delta'
MSGILRSLRGQDRAAILIDSAFDGGRVPHAWLFVGPAGTGKLTAALSAAAAWMCDDPAGWCGSCKHCRRIMAFEHPDVRVTIPVTGSVTPEEIGALFARRASDGTTPLDLPGNCTISIDSVREVQARLAMKPFEGRGRAEILVGADRMRQEGANALLKTLEEPPDGTLLILTAVRGTAVLPTVRSRTQIVRFGRLSAEQVGDELAARTGMDATAAARLAAACDGSVGSALSAAAEGDDLSEDASEALGILLSSGCSDVIELAAVLAKKLGTGSSWLFCSRMRAVIHDLRRIAGGAEPLYSVESDLPRDGMPGTEALNEAARQFAVCEYRLRAGAMPQAALTAALTGAWHAFSTGRKGALERVR